MLKPVRRVAVVGAGIVGLATARELVRRQPGLEVVVLDKEPGVGAHQTGHNSGVVHAGVYYQPGSLKATLCRRGAQLLREYCAAHHIAYRELGKLVVARTAGELPALMAIRDRAVANGVPGIAVLTRSELREIEPHAEGVAAVHSPHTAVVDYAAVAMSLAADVTQAGGSVLLNREVVSFQDHDDGIVAITAVGDVRADRLVSCAGLGTDRLARLLGAPDDPRIIPFRGEYFRLAPEAARRVRGLIYPVPDPQYPFLGVHFTRGVDDAVTVGPNAVLALANEGYRRRDIDLGDLFRILGWPGTRKMVARYWRTGIEEMWGSLSRRAYAAQAARYMPELRSSELVRAGAGVRAQAVDRGGRLVDDFVIHRTGRAVLVRNAPSPAATSSLAIAESIAEIVLDQAT